MINNNTNNSIVLIPHYNNFNGLLKSISSIEINENIDVLIVDDGSNKNTINEVKIKDSFKGYGNIYFKYLLKNKGIEYALNEGLKFIIKKKYKYTARLDCDDICLNRRFYKQKQFLENNPEIKLIGSNVIFKDTKGNTLYKLNLPEKHKDIKKKMYLNAMIIHPTIMFCTNILSKTGFYPTNFKAAEDYAFLFQVIKYFKVANLNEYLVICEINSKGISIINRREQVKNRINIILQNFYFGFFPIFGLLRSLFLYFTPVSFLIFVKKKLK